MPNAGDGKVEQSKPYGANRAEGGQRTRGGPAGSGSGRGRGRGAAMSLQERIDALQKKHRGRGGARGGA